MSEIHASKNARRTDRASHTTYFARECVRTAIGVLLAGIASLAPSPGGAGADSVPDSDAGWTIERGCPSDEQRAQSGGFPCWSNAKAWDLSGNGEPRQVGSAHYVCGVLDDGWTYEAVMFATRTKKGNVRTKEPWTLTIRWGDEEEPRAVAVGLQVTRVKGKFNERTYWYLMVITKNS